MNLDSFSSNFRRLQLVLFCTGFAMALLIQPVAATTPVRVDPFEMADTNGSILDDIHRATGFLQGPFGRGSAASVASRKLAFTAAHVIWKDYRWASPSQIHFYPGYNSSSPPTGPGESFIGMSRWQSYSDNNDNDGLSDINEAVSDFAILFSFSDILPQSTYPIPHAYPGGIAMTSSAPKMMVGYPSSLDHNGASGYSFQHKTTTYERATSLFPGKIYRFLNGASTGPGNSGGPLVSAEHRFHPITGGLLGWNQMPWYYVGHVIAGDATSVDVRVFDESCSDMLVDLQGDQSGIGNLTWNTHIVHFGWGEDWDTPSSSPEIRVDDSAGIELVSGGSEGVVFEPTAPRYFRRETITIRNIGSADLSGISASLHGADASHFSIVAQPETTLTPAGSTSLVIQFSPQSLGSKSATLRIASNDTDENPYNITIEGVGIAPVLQPDIEVLSGGVSLTSGSGTADVGSVEAGFQMDHYITVRNTGEADLTVHSTSLSGGNTGSFSIFLPLGSPPIRPNESSTFGISFHPQTAGSYSTTLTILSNDSDESPFVVQLTGTGAEPDNDHGDDSSRAHEVSSGNSITSAELGGNGDRDWFRFSVEAEERVRIYTTGNTDTVGGLHHDTDNGTFRYAEFLVDDDDSGDAKNFLIEQVLRKGDYFIAVKGFSAGVTGQYDLHIERIGDPGDTGVIDRSPPRVQFTGSRKLRPGKTRIRVRATDDVGLSMVRFRAPRSSKNVIAGGTTYKVFRFTYKGPVRKRVAMRAFAEDSSGKISKARKTFSGR